MEIGNTYVDPAKGAALAQQVAAILAEADVETRRRAVAAAMALLGDGPIATRHLAQTHDPLADPVDMASFFTREEDLRPADNAYLCAAFHYARHGSAAFSLQDLRGIAGEAGVVLPDRLDMTLKQAARSGKKLFQSVGKDSYKPTAVAGMTFKERWGVTPGRTEKRVADNP